MVATGLGHARNLAVVASGEVVIAIGGEWGTLSEIGHARASAAPWSPCAAGSSTGASGMEGAPGVVAAATAEEAVTAALDCPLDRAGAAEPLCRICDTNLAAPTPRV